MIGDRTRRHRIRLRCGLHISYLEAGQGPCLLLLHGFPELAISWRAQLEALADQYRVIAPDLRGYGQSDAPRGWRHYRPGRLVADIGELCDALDEPRVHLVGHDWGGAIAWETAAQLPERIQTVASLNCPHPRVLMRRLLSSPDQLRRSWYMALFQLPWLPERLAARDNGWTTARLLRQTAVNTKPFDDEHLAPYAEHARQGLRGPINYYRAAFRSPPLPRRTIDAPALLIWGTGDRFLGPELAHPQAYRGLVRDLRVVRIPGSGHWVQQEAADTVNQLIRQHAA